MHARVFSLLSLIYLTAIFGLPLASVVALWAVGDSLIWHALVAVTAPMLYAVLFLIVASLLSLPHQKGVVPGRFPRKLSHPVYFHRRLYGLCWTAVYYFKPVYFLCLSLPWLKWLTFRLFG